MQNFFIWLKVMLRSSKRWWLWKEPVVGWHWWLWKELVVVVMYGNWNVGQATSQQVLKLTTFCTVTCFQFFRHWSTASSTMLCWNPAHVATVCFRKLSISRIGTRYTIYALLQHAPECSNLPGWGQDWWTAVSYCAETWLCHEHDVLAHCLAGRQRRLQQCCRSP